MELSYKILSVKGIDVELHLFFLLFILLLLIVNPMLSLLMGIAFFFVTIHELMHSLVAIRNGVKVRRIVLLPIGGMSVVETADIKPLTEIKIAIAGPLVNFVFVYLCLAIAAVFNMPLNDWATMLTADPSYFPGIGQMLLLYTFYTNWALGFFNMVIPAFPLDGGRIFRALLALKLDYIRATAIAKTTSLVITVLLFILGAMSQNILLMIIAFFIGFGATAEYDATVLHRVLRRVTVADLLSTNYVALQRNDKVLAAVRKMVEARTFSALCGDRVVEFTALTAVPRDRWKREYASRFGVKVATTPSDAAEHASKTMQELGIDMIPVYKGKALAGVVYRNDIEKVARIAEIIHRNGKGV
jgi:Zn-dependent protease